MFNMKVLHNFYPKHRNFDNVSNQNSHILFIPGKPGIPLFPRSPTKEKFQFIFVVKK